MDSKLSCSLLLLVTTFLISCSGIQSAEFNAPLDLPQLELTDEDEAAAMALLDEASLQKQKLEDNYGIEFTTFSETSSAERSGSNKSLTEGSFTSKMFLPQAETSDIDLDAAQDDMLADLWAFGLLGLEIKNNGYLKAKGDPEKLQVLDLESRLSGRWSGSHILVKTAQSQRQELGALHNLGLTSQPVVANSQFMALNSFHQNLDPETIALRAEGLQRNCEQTNAVLEHTDAFEIKIVNLSGIDIYCAPGSLSRLTIDFSESVKGLNAVDIQRKIEKLRRAVTKDAYQQSLNLLADNGLVYSKKSGAWTLNKKKRERWERSQYEDFTKALRGPQVIVFNVEPNLASKDQVFREAVLRNGLGALAFHINAARAWSQFLEPSDARLENVDQRRLAATSDFFSWKQAFVQLNPNAWVKWWLPSDEGYSSPAIGTQASELEPNYEAIFNTL